MAGPRFLSVALMMKLLFLLRCLRAVACIGFRLLKLILLNFLEETLNKIEAKRRAEEEQRGS